MNKIVKFETKIGGLKHTVSIIDATDKQQTVKAVRTHHVLLLDRSGSMSWSINKLIDQVMKTVDKIGSNDLLSIGWFSGSNQFSFVLKGVSKGQDVNTILGTLRSTVGLTCFSEILNETKKVISELESLVDQTVVTLFTDGQPVVAWSEAEELTRCQRVLADLRDGLNVPAFNTIGYGHYYNPEFLKKLSDSTDHGFSVHNVNIEEFLDTFTSGVITAGGLTRQSLSVETGADSDILYVGSHSSSLHENELHMKSLGQSFNLVYVITTDAKDTICVNDEEPVTIGSLTKSADYSKEDFFYAYAYQLYYRGKRQKALDIVVNNLRDKYLADLMINSFTLDEVGTTTSALLDAVRGDRYKGGKCSVGYLPKKDALCVMDIFQRMFDVPNSVFYIPFSKNVDEYQRIGRKVEDKQNIFTADDTEVRAPLSEFVWNKDKLNLSIRIPIFGVADLNHRSAKAVGLTQKHRCMIYRTHTFVKDGNLNLTKGEFLIENFLWSALDQMLPASCAEYVSQDGIHDKSTGKSYQRVVIDFSKLPVINRTYVDNSDSLDDLHKIVYRILSLEAAQKVLNNVLEETIAAAPDLKKSGDFANLKLEQIRVLEEHGISKENVYGGIQNEKPSSDDSDKYYIRLLKFYIKGCSSLPSIVDFKSMISGEKKPNLGGQLMVDYYKKLSTDLNLSKPTKVLVELLRNEKKSISNELISCRQRLNLIKLAKTLTNDFFHGLVANEKGDYSYEKEKVTMILRADRVAEYV